MDLHYGRRYDKVEKKEPRDHTDLHRLTWIWTYMDLHYGRRYDKVEKKDPGPLCPAAPKVAAS